MKADPRAKHLQDMVFSATPEDLVLMLYDGAVKFCNQSIMAMENDDIAKANEMSLRAQDIIRELQITLNTDYEIANGLAQMYDYIHHLLVKGNISNNKELVEEARDHIREFRNTWKEAMKLAKQNTPGAAGKQLSRSVTG